MSGGASSGQRPAGFLRGRGIGTVCPGSGGGLAGESPVRVMDKQPCSWWPTEGETRPAKRHDEAALGGEQVLGPYVEESCCVEILTAWEPNRTCRGEGHGRREDLGRAALKTHRRRGDRNENIAHHGTGEIRLGTGMTTAGSQPATSSKGETYKRIIAVKWSSAERKSEEVICSCDGVDNTTRRSQGPLAGCVVKAETTAGLSSWTITRFQLEPGL